jgi:hypothetical protein
LVVNGNIKTIGRMEGNSIHAIRGVGDFYWLERPVCGHSFTSFKLGDRSGYIVLAGASRNALEKLPVFATDR